MPEPSSPGRRRAAEAMSRRPSPVLVLAVLLPLLTVATLGLVRSEAPVGGARGPDRAPLSRTTLVCPQAVGRTGTVAVANTEGATGDVATRAPTQGAIRLGRGTERTGVEGATVLEGEGELASGLLAMRYGAAAAAPCATPATERWFTGVGAAAQHASILELVNPDGGPAVADVTVLGPQGPLDVAALRGVTVPGGQVARFDLSQVAPSRDELALHVLVSRGRLGVHVLDIVDELGAGARSRDWLPGQAAPATTSYLMGLGGKPGERTLAVANPSDSQVRVRLEVVSAESEFAPATAPDLRIDPGAVASVALGRLLAGRAARGAIGLRLEATEPVTASLRTMAAGDLSHAVAGEAVGARAGLALPAGPKRLVLGGASALGVVTWTATDERGRPVGRERVEVSPGAGHRIKLPADAALLVVEVDRTEVVGVVEVGPPGLAVLGLADLVLSAAVPDVRPALR